MASDELEASEELGEAAFAATDAGVSDDDEASLAGVDAADTTMQDEPLEGLLARAGQGRLVRSDFAAGEAEFSERANRGSQHMVRARTRDAVCSDCHTGRARSIFVLCVHKKCARA